MSTLTHTLYYESHRVCEVKHIQTFLHGSDELISALQHTPLSEEVSPRGGAGAGGSGRRPRSSCTEGCQRPQVYVTLCKASWEHTCIHTQFYCVIRTLKRGLVILEGGERAGYQYIRPLPLVLSLKLCPQNTRTCTASQQLEVNSLFFYCVRLYLFMVIGT